jgi:hypothetical protein
MGQSRRTDRPPTNEQASSVSVGMPQTGQKPTFAALFANVIGTCQQRLGECNSERHSRLEVES